MYRISILEKSFVTELRLFDVEANSFLNAAKEAAKTIFGEIFENDIDVEKLTLSFGFMFKPFASPKYRLQHKRLPLLKAVIEIERI